jgi:ComF family protein
METMLKAHYQNRPLPDLLIPAPLAYFRQFKRGYNQAHEIARRLAKRLKLPYSPHLLKKIKHTEAQAGLTRRLREKNIKGSFEVIPPIPTIKSIALLDDVMTTGATLRELSKTLHQAGISEIHLWVLARTGR